MIYSTVQLSIIGLAALSVVSAGRDPSKEAKQQYAKQWQSLSKSCQASLMTIADSKSDISKCTHAGKLFNNVVTNSAVDEETPLVPIIQDWLEDDLCASEACPSTVVQEALNQVANTCSAEIEKQMWLPAIAQAVLISYETAREAVCLKDTGAKDNSTSYCPAEVLNNIGTTGTPITYAQGQIALKNPQAAVDGVPTWAYCTPCTQGLMVPVVNALNTLNPEWATIMTNAVDSKCGTGFVVTTTPASLESGITYEEPGAGNDTSTDGINGEGSGSGDEFDEGSTGFHTRSLATSGAVLLSLAALVVFGL